MTKKYENMFGDKNPTKRKEIKTKISVIQKEVQNRVEVKKKNRENHLGEKNRAYKRPTKKLILDKNLCYILGVLKGDGHISINQISLAVIDKDFALAFKKVLEVWSNYKVSINFYKNQSNTYWVTLCSIYVVNFLKKIDIYKIKNMDNECKAMFLKGMYDSEGCVSIKEIYLYNCNKQLLHFCKDLLLLLNIKSNDIRIHTKRGTIMSPLNGRIPIAKKDCYELSITGKENIIRFKNLVNFSIKRKRNKLINTIKSYKNKNGDKLKCYQD